MLKRNLLLLGMLYVLIVKEQVKYFTWSEGIRENRGVDTINIIAEDNTTKQTLDIHLSVSRESLVNFGLEVLQGAADIASKEIVNAILEDFKMKSNSYQITPEIMKMVNENISKILAEDFMDFIKNGKRVDNKNV